MKVSAACSMDIEDGIDITLSARSLRGTDMDMDKDIDFSACNSGGIPMKGS